MVLISFKTAKTKKHIANFRFSYQIHFVVHYVDYLSEDITQRLIMFLASKSLRLPISSERNRPFLRKERETHISSERIRFGYLPCGMCKKTKSITSLTTPGEERIHKSGKKWNINTIKPFSVVLQRYSQKSLIRLLFCTFQNISQNLCWKEMTSVNIEMIDAQHCQVRHFGFVFSLPFTESINF